MNKYIVILLVLLSSYAYGQSPAMYGGDDLYHLIDRLHIKNHGDSAFHTSQKYYDREEVARYLTKVYREAHNLSEQDKMDILYFIRENNDFIPDETFLNDSNSIQLSSKVSWKKFYRTPAHFFEHDSEVFGVRVTPFFNFRAGSDSNQSGKTFFNQRGIELRGHVDRKVWFETSIYETQSRFAKYVNDYIQETEAVPGVAFYKRYNSDIFNVNGGYDYLDATGNIGVDISEHVAVSFGHGKHFIGDGARSLFLSDFSNNYFHLKFNTQVWKFKYQNVFGELNSKKFTTNQLTPKKYFAAHHLSFNPNEHISLGLFEAVVFSRENNFEFQYLNPLILYRTVEQMIGSSDNVVLGFNGSAIMFDRIKLYGQVLLDEFKFKELTSGSGWWANKYAIQAGFKTTDMFNVDHLDLQFETNTVRPFTYSHFDQISSYSNTNQALAHPLGSNFTEVMLSLRYRPFYRLSLEGTLIDYTKGLDIGSDNYGGNILLDNNTRIQDFDNEITQGNRNSVMILDFLASYQLKHDLYVDMGVQRRRERPEIGVEENSTWLEFGFRYNISNRRDLY